MNLLIFVIYQRNRYLLNCIKMKVVFLLTVVGVMAQFVHAEEKQCGVNDMRTLMVAVNHLRAELKENKEKFSALEKEVQQLRRSTDILQNQTEALGRNPNQTTGFVAKSNNISSYCNGTLLFDDIVLNRGGMFDSHTGYFTAPFSSMYLFTVQVCFYYRSYISVSITSPTRGTFSQSFFSGSYYYYYGDSCYSVTTVAHLSQGEQVFANCTGGNTIVQSSDQYWTMFAGALL